MTKAVFRKRGRSLVPVDREGLALLATIKGEHDVVVEVTARRNPKHHRLFFAMCKFVVEHSTHVRTIEQAVTALKIACGEVDVYVNENGKAFFIPRSISWAAMDQTRFARFFDRAVWVITNRWMPAGTTEESVRASLESMVEPSDGRDYAPRRILIEDQRAGVRARERPLRNVHSTTSTGKHRI